VLRQALGRDWKGKASPILYSLAIAAALWWPGISQGIFVLVALLWLVPDRRIERQLTSREN
jgi:hypothetical protein